VTPDGSGGHPPIDFLQRRLDLRLPNRVRRGFALPHQLGTRQPERFDRPVFFGIRYRSSPAAPFVLARIHLFLEPGFRVD
jgi:hypothetical protein